MADEREYADEEAIGKALDWALLRRLTRYLRPYRVQVAAAFALLALQSLLGIIPPWLIKVAVDEQIARGDVAGLSRTALLFVAVLVTQFAVNYAQLVLVARIGQLVMFDMRLSLFSHLQRMSLSFFDRNPVGRLMTRVTSDVEVLNELFTSGLISVFGDIFLLFGILGAIVVLDPKLAAVSLSVAPLLVLATHLFRVKVREAYRDIRGRVARINANLQESLTGMRVIQLFGQEERAFGAFERVNREHMDAFQRSILYYALFFPAVDLLGAIALGLIFWHGGGEVVRGTISLGVLIAFIQYVQGFFRPIRDLSEKYNTFQNAMASSERIFGLLDEPEGIADRAGPAPALPEREATRGEVRFERVWFAYKGDDWVLRDVSLAVRPGEKVALVGATGSGKTTLVQLLGRYYEPARGRITLDGVDLRDWPQRELRRRLAVVPQDVFLFSGSIEENVRLGKPIPREAVERAARVANADRFIRDLPDGYNTVLHERGGGLSAGERQLLAFARALAVDPPILILDEATSHIDSRTEGLIQEALERLLAGRTAILIAHRLSTIRSADRIVVLHKGEVREEGTHAELLTRGGVYARLHRLESLHEDEVA
jgi:ATP-binding cassette subfamily B protein